MDPPETLVTKLNELLVAVQQGEVDTVKSIVNWFGQDVDRNKTLLRAVYAGARPCATEADLVLAACSHNQKRVLNYLLSETDILDYLTDGTQVNEKRTEAVKHALRLGDFEMVEQLNNYWNGDLYLNEFKKENFMMLGKILKDAENPAIVRDQQLLINFKSLVALNDFQQELYSNLPQPLPRDAAAKDIARVLLTVLSIYDKYSHIEKVRISSVTHEIERWIKSYIEDRSSTYIRALLYIKYEVYFRKLDFNIALLLLEKLYIIRDHLEKRFNKPKSCFKENKTIYPSYISASSTYKEIECAIYHLIYRTSEDWRLYLPADRQSTQLLTHHVDRYNGRIIGKHKSTYDPHKLYNGPVLYFERRYFKRSLTKLKKILKKHVIAKDPTQPKNHNSKDKLLILLDKNYLKPYMSDHYSLSKIVTYMEALEHTTNADILMTERVLQVVGEMMKASEDSSHLSEFTNALLQIAITANTFKHLLNIRTFLSHADEGQLSIRIDIENNQADMLRNIKAELVKIKEQIVPILDLCKSVLDKSLLQKGLDLLENRINKLPEGARQRVDEIFSLYKERGNELVLESGQYFREVWEPACLSHQLLKEIPQLLLNRDEISSKLKLIESDINNKITKILPTYIQNARLTLERISENSASVDKFNHLLDKEKANVNCKKTHKYYDNVKLGYLPDKNNINGYKKNKVPNNKKFNQGTKTEMKEILYNLIDYSRDWKSIEVMVNGCLKKFGVFAPIKSNNFGTGNSPDPSTITTLYTILEKMEVVCLMRNSTLAQFCGKYLVEWGRWVYRPLREMISRSEPTSFTAIETLHKNTDKKIKSNGEELIKCLINRIELLRKHLGYPQRTHLRQHVQRYELDPEFRYVLEMLLSDIEIIIKLKNKKLVSKKSNKLLEGIVLRNVLAHGNPFLEVIGDVFDSQELPRELLSRAKSFAEDQEAVEALLALLKDNVDFDTINNGTLANMNDTQKEHYSKLKQSQNWKCYVGLIRKYHIGESGAESAGDK